MTSQKLQVMWNLILFSAVGALGGLDALAQDGANNTGRWWVIVSKYNTATIKWNEVTRNGPYNTEDEANNVKRSQQNKFRTEDGYAVEVKERPDSKQGQSSPQKQKTLTSTPIDQIKTPDSIWSKRPGDDNKEKKNFVMWLEQEQNGQWVAVPNKRFEYPDMTEKEFKQKLEMYEKAVESENNKAKRIADEAKARGQLVTPIRLRARWNVEMKQASIQKYDPDLCTGRWRPKGERRTFEWTSTTRYFRELEISPEYNGKRGWTFYFGDSRRGGGQYTVTSEGKCLIPLSRYRNETDRVAYRRDKNSPLIVDTTIDGKISTTEYVRIE